MKFLVCILFFMSFVFSADVSISQSDFVERVINFVIFFSILWYLAADKIKEIFVQRRGKISCSFDEIQEKEKKIKKQKQEAESLVADARNRANEIVSNAKKEAFLIAQNLDLRLKEDLKNVSSSFEVILEQERRKILQQEITQALDQSFAPLALSDDACVKILEKGISNG